MNSYRLGFELGLAKQAEVPPELLGALLGGGVGAGAGALIGGKGNRGMGALGGGLLGAAGGGVAGNLYGKSEAAGEGLEAVYENTVNRGRPVIESQFKDVLNVREGWMEQLKAAIEKIIGDRNLTKDQPLRTGTDRSGNAGIDPGPYHFSKEETTAKRNE